MSLAGKRMFITGGSRGIGLAIALRAAQDGAHIAIAAKTAEANPKLPGTIFSAAKEIEAAGGTYWMGDVKKDGGFYEVKYFDPHGVVVDITEDGWRGACKDVTPASN